MKIISNFLNMCEAFKIHLIMQSVHENMGNFTDLIRLDDALFFSEEAEAINICYSIENRK